MNNQQPIIQQALTLSSTYIKKVDFDCGSYNKECTSDLDFSLTTETLFPSNVSNLFLVDFKSILKNKPGKDKFMLKIEFQAIFYTQDEITEEFKQSAFVHVNAPAIAFPFLRSFVATLLSNAGYSPVILNSINFAASYRPKVNK